MCSLVGFLMAPCGISSGYPVTLTRIPPRPEASTYQLGKTPGKKHRFLLFVLGSFEVNCALCQGGGPGFPSWFGLRSALFGLYASSLSFSSALLGMYASFSHLAAQWYRRSLYHVTCAAKSSPCVARNSPCAAKIQPCAAKYEKLR